VALLALLFVVALGVGLAVGSSRGEEQPVEPVGSAAVPLDVPAAGDAPSGLGKAAPLPALARRPKPPPKEPPVTPEPEPVPENPVIPEPVAPEPPAPAPAPAPAPPPTPEPPPVEFDDEG
jgi:outer membrane biosynthesis protein TonB